MEPGGIGSFPDWAKAWPDRAISQIASKAADIFDAARRYLFAIQQLPIQARSDRLSWYERIAMLNWGNIMLIRMPSGIT
ncbi:MAG: hypothetical protein Tsb0019_14340 [Roseibium sp.]